MSNLENSPLTVVNVYTSVYDMTNYRSVAARVAKQKADRPDLYCPANRCLWRTGGGRCPRHGGSMELTDNERTSAESNLGQLEGVVYCSSKAVR